MSDMNSSVEYSRSASGAGAPAPELSTPQTLSGIFFEPARVFESFRVRPRFLVAGLIILLSIVAYQFLFTQRIGHENIVRARIEAGGAEMSPEQKQQAIEMQSNPIAKWIELIITPVVICIIFAAGAGLYLLGTLAMGKSISYKQALAVWIYSSLPRALFLIVGNLILLFVKSPDDMDIVSASRGLLRANPGFLVDGTAHPVLATALGSIDLLAIYALVLAALGLRKVARLSSGAAWTVVLAIWAVGFLILLGMSALFKQPMA